MSTYTSSQAMQGVVAKLTSTYILSFDSTRGKTYLPKKTSRMRYVGVQGLPLPMKKGEPQERTRWEGRGAQLERVWTAVTGGSGRNKVFSFCPGNEGSHRSRLWSWAKRDSRVSYRPCDPRFTASLFSMRIPRAPKRIDLGEWMVRGISWKWRRTGSRRGSYQPCKKLGWRRGKQPIVGLKSCLFIQTCAWRLFSVLPTTLVSVASNWL